VGMVSAESELYFVLISLFPPLQNSYTSAATTRYITLAVCLSVCVCVSGT
jgi:hypothetical protein